MGRRNASTVILDRRDKKPRDEQSVVCEAGRPSVKRVGWGKISETLQMRRTLSRHRVSRRVMACTGTLVDLTPVGCAAVANWT